MDKKFLFEMLSTMSVSGNEQALEKKIYDHYKKKVDEVRTDELSCVTAVVNPKAKFKVLLTGHADEIGLMVTNIMDNGMLKVTNLGAIYTTCYPGHKVRIDTKKGIIYGAVVNTRSLSKNAELKASDLTIDIGAKDKKDAEKCVSLGDTVTFDTEYRELLNNRITGRALDDRLGAFIVMEAVSLAKKKGCKIGAYATATTGEETTMNGAYFSASRVQPNIAIAVDVTYATDYPGTNSANTGDIRVGLGPVICNNPSVHKIVNERLKKAADKMKIKVQYEAANGRTGTDGDVMHKTGIGVPFALVSIPLRYMHCPDETGSLDDVNECIELLAEFLCECTANMNLKFF
ncbi:MAG: M20/M25/M40 family metallo-hydrolase [Lachnospiraceae bacterium]|nr:M20/M25/M40 family metallo-hydrolase [Lachnospiraceae bacterium]